MNYSTRNSVPFEDVEDDGGILFDVQKSKSGALTACVRVWGRVIIDGETYEYDRALVRVRLKKARA